MPIARRCASWASAGRCPSFPAPRAVASAGGRRRSTPGGAPMSRAIARWRSRSCCRRSPRRRWRPVPLRRRCRRRPGILQQIGFDQQLGEQLPLDLPFRDETGKDVQLGDYFGQEAGRPEPRLLQLPDALHAQPERPRGRARGALVRARAGFRGRHGQLRPARRRRCWPPRRSGPTSKRYKRSEAERGWHFLTGTQASTERLTAAVGFRYAWDEETKQFAHAARRPGADPGRPAVALPLRRRVRAEGPAPRARRGRRAAGSAASSTQLLLLLLPLRPADRPLQRGRS